MFKISIKKLQNCSLFLHALPLFTCSKCQSFSCLDHPTYPWLSGLTVNVYNEPKLCSFLQSFTSSVLTAFFTVHMVTVAVRFAVSAVAIKWQVTFQFVHKMFLRDLNTFIHLTAHLLMRVSYILAQ